MLTYSHLGLNDVKIVGLDETSSPSASCPHCHSLSNSIKDRKSYQIIDKPLDIFPIILIVKKRIFFCSNPACSFKSFIETINGLPSHSSFTDNFKTFLSTLYRDMDRPSLYKHLIHKYKLHIPFSTLHYLLKNFKISDAYADRPSIVLSPKFIGLDEFSYANGHSYAVALVNIDSRKIIDVVAGGKTTATALATLNSIDTSNVLACAIDMWLPYKTACRLKLPNAAIVVDKFHLIKNINETIEKVRKRISLHLDKLIDSFLYSNRFILLKGKERLSNPEKTKLSDILAVHNDLTTTYLFKERFRDLYLINDRDSARTSL